jgi:hypothetical protein
MVESMAKAHAGSSDDHWEAYNRFLLSLAVTIAHELVHCFMGFLSGTEKADTPLDLMGIKVSYGGTWGDSGTVWEHLVLGGCVMSYEESEHPLGTDQAGVLWLSESQNCVRRIAIDGRRGESAPSVRIA